MPLQLTPEQRQAVLANEGQPLHIHDVASRKVFLLIEQGSEPELNEEYIGLGLQTAREQIEQGYVSESNIDSIISEAKRRHTESP